MVLCDDLISGSSCIGTVAPPISTEFKLPATQCLVVVRMSEIGSCMLGRERALSLTQC